MMTMRKTMMTSILGIRYPSTYTPSSTGTCTFSISKISSDICQVLQCFHFLLEIWKICHSQISFVRLYNCHSNQRIHYLLHLKWDLYLPAFYSTMWTFSRFSNDPIKFPQISINIFIINRNHCMKIIIKPKTI